MSDPDRIHERPSEEQIAAWKEASLHTGLNEFLCQITTSEGKKLLGYITPVGYSNFSRASIFIPIEGDSKKEKTKAMIASNHKVLPNFLDGLGININQIFGLHLGNHIRWSTCGGYEDEEPGANAHWVSQIVVSIDIQNQTNENDDPILIAATCSKEFSQLMGEGWKLEPLSPESLRQLPNL